MTKVKISSGICGFSTIVTAEKGKGRKIHIKLDTECEMAGKMADEIGILDVMAVFTGFLNNPVYRAAAKNLRHVACPVTSGILKAIEVELGICLPKDVTITFLESRKISKSSSDKDEV